MIVVIDLFEKIRQKEIADFVHSELDGNIVTSSICWWKMHFISKNVLSTEKEKIKLMCILKKILF